ncbi:hypothetical protein PILCRDRAFT_417131 [Piloderma croceum F 1598]|uniref:Uncharacterized protein n=1 Tax=Piloderma croceum (strain F 1598) TaxID=765440 RepID=A0A0C3FWN0_PILCF|nr:hypothetical protein PILCRDRAFT_417131 [Piloderma croceum F 1598]
MNGESTDLLSATHIDVGESHGGSNSNFSAPKINTYINKPQRLFNRVIWEIMEYTRVSNEPLRHERYDSVTVRQPAHDKV